MNYAERWRFVPVLLVARRRERERGQQRWNARRLVTHRRIAEAEHQRVIMAQAANGGLRIDTERVPDFENAWQREQTDRGLMIVP